MAPAWYVRTGRFVSRSAVWRGGASACLYACICAWLINQSQPRQITPKINHTSTFPQQTVTGKTVAENLAGLPGLSAGQEIILPVEQPIKPSGHLQILYGNLAPQGSVAKITGKEGELFEGVAAVYDAEEDMLAALERKEIKPGMVIVIRYEGPKGGPGMPEMLTPTSAIMGAGLGKDVALITDGRFSGGSHGFVIGHITPEAQEGGPIALIQNGDKIVIDASPSKRTIDVMISEEEMAKRKAAWKPRPYPATRGTLYKYIKNVSPASEGCVTDE